jgi:hypothetical protein
MGHLTCMIHLGLQKLKKDFPYIYSYIIYMYLSTFVSTLAFPQLNALNKHAKSESCHVNLNTGIYGQVVLEKKTCRFFL